MAFKYTGDAALGVGLTVETAKPLDNRTVVANLQELYSIPEKYAYQGMTVANIDNGNIYMLLDKSKINQKEGWKASYESIQIIQCTEAEYKQWKANTTNDFKPIDESLEYLHAESYYYIYEDSMDNNQFYLSAAWGKNIEDQLKEKALNTTVVAIRQDLNKLSSDLGNYSTSEEIAGIYVPKSDLDLKNPESFLSTTLSNYYTKTESDELFVTKESLRGEGIEGDNFVFVTKAQYDVDYQAIQNELSKTIKVDEEGVLESLVTKQIKSPDGLIVNVQSDGLYINDNKLATQSEIPNLVTLTETEYLELVENNQIQADTYYYVYDVTNDAKVYITKEFLDLNYHTTNQYQSWVATNYYNKSYIDSTFATIAQLSVYYTKEEINQLFLTKENASSTYATKQSVSELTTNLTENYVTKESLRGGLEGGDDFVFVTQSKYTEDQGANAQEYTTQKLNTEQIALGDSIITSQDGKVLSSGEEISLVKDVPKLMCISETEYEALPVKNKDTYYYTYSDKDLQDTGYVRSEFLYEKFYTKTEVDELIRQAIASLQEQINQLQINNSGTVNNETS